MELKFTAGPFTGRTAEDVLEWVAGLRDGDHTRPMPSMFELINALDVLAREITRLRG